MTSNNKKYTLSRTLIIIAGIGVWCLAANTQSSACVTTQGIRP